MKASKELDNSIKDLFREFEDEINRSYAVDEVKEVFRDYRRKLMMLVDEEIDYLHRGKSEQPKKINGHRRPDSGRLSGHRYDREDFSDEIEAVEKLIQEAELVRDRDYYKIKARQIPDPKTYSEDGSRLAHNGKSCWWVYKMHNGGEIYVPNSGSRYRNLGSVELVGSIAVNKLQRVLTWLREGKPKRFDWAVKG
jgi:hypothetical protein